MPIDFSLLNAKAPSSNMQSLGSYPQTQNPLNSLAGGIMQGVQEGQQMQANAQDMKQKAALFPSVLQNAQNQAAMSTIDLSTKQGAAAQATVERQAAAQGLDNYMNVLKTTNPTSWADMQQKLEDVQNKHALTLNTMQDMHTKQLQNTMNESGLLATAAATVSSITKDPQQQQAVWEIQKKRFENAGIDPSQYPAQFDQNWATAMVATQHINNANYLELHPQAATQQPQIGKLEDLQAEKQKALDDAIKNKGVNSPEAIQAKDDLQKVQQSVQNEARDKEGFVSGILHSINNQFSSDDTTSSTPQSTSATKTLTFNPKTGKLE